MTYYVRDSDPRRKKWRPEDTELADKVIASVGVEKGDTVTDATAAKIRHEYKRLYNDKHGATE